MKQKGRRKRILSMILGWLLIVSNVLPGISVQAAEQREATIEEQEVSDKAEVENTSYEIYPTPHSVEYQEGTYAIQDVNLVYDSTIDVAVRNRMKEILEAANINYEITETVAENKTNILVGIYKGTDKTYIQQKMEEKVTVAASDFDKMSAHYVVSMEGNIYVLGKDLDAAFYGATTLKHIFSQLDNSEIRNFTIKDYADVNIRGFIEGYYGIPWSNEDRMSLMKFGGDFKMTSYIFAPKDDIYHTTRWREEYPADMLEDIKEMVAVGNASKCRFVWTAHPFMNGGNFGVNNSIEQEIQHLLNKFEQLYGVGVRQFGVLADDVGNVDKNAIVQVMNAISEWAKEKKDVYDTVYCPQGYNHSWQGNYSELNKYDQEFPEDIQIFWTGQAVCQPISVETLNNFRNHNLPSGAESRRAPLFWLNWPVNDINHGRMLMGKGSLLHTDVDPANLAGAVTNPMQEAEASKNALFAVADYTWNIEAFNADTSWVDGFKYIEPDATEELFILANHMSDPSPNGHGLVLDESENIKDMLSAYLAGESDGEDLKTEFQKIIKACDDFHVKSQNDDLKDELLPFTSSLKDLMNSALLFMDAKEASDAGLEEEAWVAYVQGGELFTASKNYMKPKIDGEQAVSPGSKRLIPFVNELYSSLSETVISGIDEGKQTISFYTNRTNVPANALELITDNNEATEVIIKNPNVINAGDYVGIRYLKAIELDTVVFKLGQSGNPDDTFKEGTVQYTSNGKDWIEIEGSSFTDGRNVIRLENLNLMVKGIRIIATADKGNTWLGIKDIIINEPPVLEEAVILEGTLSVPEGYSIYQGNEANTRDRNESTILWYRTPGDSFKANDGITLDLGDKHTIGRIYFSMPSGDCLSNYTLQYSEDGSVYHDIKNFTSLQAEVDLSGQDVLARYIRVLNKTNTGKWLKISEFTVEPATALPVYTNKESNTTAISTKIQPDKGEITGNVSLLPGEYVGLDLGRIKDISRITAEYEGEAVLETSKNEVIWKEYSKDSLPTEFEDARYIRIINKGQQEISLSITSLVAESFEVYPISVKETNFGNEATHLKAFDNDRTTEAVLQASQHQGKYIIYDLGQTITLDSLKLVLHDGTTDYPRHAKVMVATDDHNWEDVMVIGNQVSDNNGEANNTDDISDLFPSHEISYRTLETKNIQKEIRYIKFEITRNKAGEDKWVRIREIELNGGNVLLRDENNPTIISPGGESRGNTLSNLIDGDLSTIYTPVQVSDNSLTYYVSERTELSNFVVLQTAGSISNAIVKATVSDNGMAKEISLGILEHSLNRFSTKDYDAVLEIKIEWKADKIPGICEIILNRKSDAIRKKQPILSGNLNKVYDGSVLDESKLEINTNGEVGTEYVQYFIKNSTGWVPVSQLPKNAGEYGVGVYVRQNQEDIQYLSNILKFEIQKVPLKIEDAVLEWNPDDILDVRIKSFGLTGEVSGEKLVEGTDYYVSLEVMEDNEVVRATVQVELISNEKTINYMLAEDTYAESKVFDSPSDNNPDSPSDNDPDSPSDNNPDSPSDNDPSISDNDVREGLWVEGVQEEYEYTGKAIKPEVFVYEDGKLLIEKKDYTLVHKNNTNAYIQDDQGSKAPYVEIKMKGNNTGSKKVYYRIMPVDISGEAGNVQLNADKLFGISKNGKAVKVTPVLQWNGKKLKLNKDFTMSGTNTFAVGLHTVTLQGKDNFTGTIEADIIISNGTENDKTAVLMSKVSVKGYDKKPVWKEGGVEQSGFTVEYKKKALQAESEYTVEYGLNKAVGTAYMILTGTGVDGDNDGQVFIGTKTIAYKINGTAMTKKNITISGLKEMTYTGDLIYPEVTLSSKTPMEEDVHYTASYTKNIEKGTATVTFTGIEAAGYTGSLKATFKIAPASVAEYEVTVSGAEFTDGKWQIPYTKGTTTPDWVVTTEDGEVLEAGRDYTVSYKNNKKIGADATATIKGKGNYGGTQSVSFKILKKELSNENGIQVVVKDKVETGKAGGWNQNVKVLDSNGKVLGAKDYDKKNITFAKVVDVADPAKDITLSKSDIVKAGDIIRVTVKGAGDYSGENAFATATFRILKKGYDIAKATIVINPQEYTGEEITITDQKQFTQGKVFLKVNGIPVELKLGENIEVVEGSYVKNVNKGTAKVTFRGIGEDFGGSKTVTFKINPRNIGDILEVVR